MQLVLCPNVCQSFRCGTLPACLRVFGADWRGPVTTLQALLSPQHVLITSTLSHLVDACIAGQVQVAGCNVASLIVIASLSRATAVSAGVGRRITHSAAADAVAAAGGCARVPLPQHPRGETCQAAAQRRALPRCCCSLRWRVAAAQRQPRWRQQVCGSVARPSGGGFCGSYLVLR